MKKIILIIAIAFSMVGAAQAQDRAWLESFEYDNYVPDTATVLQNMKDLAALSGAIYVGQKEYQRYFVDTTNKDRQYRPKIIFLLRNQDKGTNPELQRKGTKTYGIGTDIYGSFLSLFPLWKKYIDPDADIEYTSKQNSVDKYVKNGNFKDQIAYMEQKGGMWVLHIILRK